LKSSFPEDFFLLGEHHKNTRVKRLRADGTAAFPRESRLPPLLVSFSLLPVFLMETLTKNEYTFQKRNT